MDILKNKIDKKEAEYFENEGDKCNQKNKTEQALDCFTKAINLLSDQSRLYFKRAYIYISSNDLKMALIDLDFILELSNNELELVFAKCFISYIKNDYDDAIQHFNKVTSIDKSYSDLIKPFLLYSYQENVKLLLNKYNFDKAIINYEKAINCDKASIQILKLLFSKAYFENGNNYLENNDFDNAIDHFEKAIDYDSSSSKLIKPLILETYHGNVNYYLKNNNFDKAKLIYEKAVNYDKASVQLLKPLFSKTHFENGNKYLKSNDLDKAITHFEESKKYDYTSTQLINQILFGTYGKNGDLHFNKNEIELGIQSYEKALEIMPDKNIYLKISKCYNQLLDFKSAINILDKLINLEPNNHELYIERAETYILINNYSNALDDYILISSIKKDININYKLLKLYILNNYLDEAFNECSVILKVKPTDNDVIYIKNVINLDNPDYSKYIKRRENWESNYSFYPKSNFGFGCFSCKHYKEKYSVCTKMVEANAWPFTNTNDRCHQHTRTSK